MDDIQTILALISTLLGIILLILKIFEAWVTVSGPVKRFLSNPVVWIAIAALILLGGYWLFVYKPPPPVVALKTAHNRYVTAIGADWDWVLRAETDVIDDYEKFTPLDADTGKRRPSSEVINSLKDDGEVRIALQTWHKKDGRNRLVTAMDAEWDWKLRAETNELRDSEEFIAILLP
jgi:hypothetical protein